MLLIFLITCLLRFVHSLIAFSRVLIIKIARKSNCTYIISIIILARIN